jgi:hypothetical protein
MDMNHAIMADSLFLSFFFGKPLVVFDSLFQTEMNPNQKNWVSSSG